MGFVVSGVCLLLSSPHSVFGFVVHLVPSFSVEPNTLHILGLTFSLFLAVFDQLDLVTYEEVVKLPAFKRKTLVLLGELCRWSAGHRDICRHE